MENFIFNIDNFKMLYLSPCIFSNLLNGEKIFDYDTEKARLFELGILFLERIEDRERLQKNYNFETRKFNLFAFQ